MSDDPPHATPHAPPPTPTSPLTGNILVPNLGWGVGPWGYGAWGGGTLPSTLGELPLILLQGTIGRGGKTAEGTLGEAVAPPWFEIIRLLQQNPALAYQLGPEKWEEMVAGAYERAGFDRVTLTPRSGDHGRDVIAERTGWGAIRIVDQVKAYKPGHLVTANDVRALGFVLQQDEAAKGFVTTTSDFAPRIGDDPFISPWLGSRIELVNGTRLLRLLGDLATNGRHEPLT